MPKTPTDHTHEASFIQAGRTGTGGYPGFSYGEPEGGRGPVRDDGVCLTTVRPALRRDYKGGVSRQASSRHGGAS